MSNMNTFSGKIFNPLKMTKQDVCMADIAHALSLICRGGGHIRYFFSVAQHSMNCANEAAARGWSDRIVLACLMHDASEAYIADIIRPVKPYLNNYLNIEAQMMQVIYDYFGLADLTEEEKKCCKQIDDEMMEHELHTMMPGEENRPVPKLMSEPDFRERPYREVEAEFTDMARRWMKCLQFRDISADNAMKANPASNYQMEENHVSDYSKIQKNDVNDKSAVRKYDETAVRNGYRQLTKLLIERKMTITTMESATSGQIASMITDTEGSSAVLKGAFVTYCNEAKMMQGVPAEILEKYTVYSRETAEAMAAACVGTYEANIGIGVTGTMGNVDPANPEASIPGQVYFAIVIDGEMQSYYIELEPQPTRLAYKLAVAGEILDALMSRLRYK